MLVKIYELLTRLLEFITDLKVNINFDQACISSKIGEALYIDSKVNAVYYNVLDSFGEYLINEIIKKQALSHHPSLILKIVCLTLEG